MHEKKTHGVQRKMQGQVRRWVVQVEKGINNIEVMEVKNILVQLPEEAEVGNVVQIEEEDEDERVQV